MKPSYLITCITILIASTGCAINLYGDRDRFRPLGGPNFCTCHALPENESRCWDCPEGSR